MAKKSRRKDTDESTARRTLRAAYFFFNEAGKAEYKNVEHYGYYVEAAIVFACMVLDYLKTDKPGTQWVNNQVENNQKIKELKNQRNDLSHRCPISTTPSPKDVFYYGESATKEAHEKLPDQLKAIKTIVDECEKLFG